jgi:hypothetical protein
MLRDPWDEFRDAPEPSASTIGPPPHAPRIGQTGRIQGPARQPTPRYDDEATRARNEAAASANAPATSAEQLRALELQNQEREQALARGGLTADQANERTRLRTRLEAATGQFRDVAERYRGGYQNDDLAGWMPSFLSPGNSGFDTAAGNLSEQAFGAFRVPGIGSQSDYEGRLFARNNQLDAQSFDTSNEARLDALQGRLNANRESVGLEPIDWRNMPMAQEPPSAAPQDHVTAVEPYAGTPTGQQAREFSGGQTRLEVDPVLRGISTRLGQMMARGVPDAQIVRYLRDNGVDPSGTNVQQALQYRRRPEFQAWRRQNPGQPYPIGESFYTRDVSQTGTSRTLSRAAESPGGAYAVQAGNGLLGNRLDDLVGATGGDADQARAGIAGLRETNPTASFLGDVSGATMAYGAGAAAMRGAGVASRLPAWLRGPVAGDVAYGAYSGTGDGMENVPLAIIANAAGGVAGRGAMAGVGRAATGSRDAATRYLDARGFPLTVGQIAGQGGRVGRVIENMENTATSVPVIGPTITAQRAQGLQRLNTAAMEDVVQPIGGTQSGAMGEVANEEALGQIQQAYTQALTGVDLPRDRRIAADLTALQRRASRIPNIGADVSYILRDNIEPLFQNGRLNGPNFQAALQTVKEAQSAYRGVPLGRQATQVLRDAERALMSLARRHRPDIVPQLNQANTAYRRYSITRDASLAGMNNPGGGGEFTAAQLGRAARQGTINYGGRNQAASTSRPFFELQRHAQQVLPNSYPDSGTAGRLLAPALGLGLGGAGAGSDAMGWTDNGMKMGLGIGALSLPYTNPGRAFAQTAMVRRPDWLRTVGEGMLGQIPANVPLLGGQSGPGVVGRISAPAAGYYYAEDPYVRR